MVRPARWFWPTARCSGAAAWAPRGATVGEVCFNTSITGYQEILTDPSYAGQIITFTFPHVGNVGTNPEDSETTTPAARGLILRANITHPSNWRAAQHLDAWLKSHNFVGIAGVDTRRLTRLIRGFRRANRRYLQCRDKRRRQRHPGVAADFAGDLALPDLLKQQNLACAEGMDRGHMPPDI